MFSRKTLLLVFLVGILFIESASAVPSGFLYGFDFNDTGTPDWAENLNTSNSDMIVVGGNWSESGSLYFNGTNGVYGQIPNSAVNQITGNLTISATFNPEGYNSPVIIRKSNSYSLQLYSNLARFSVWNSSNVEHYVTASSTFVDLYENHTITGEYNGTHLNLWIDGILDNSVEYSDGVKVSTNSLWSGALSSVTGKKTRMYDLYIYGKTVDDPSSFYTEATGEMPVEVDGYARLRTDLSSRAYAPVLYIYGNLSLAEVYNNTVDYADSGTDIDMSEYMSFEGSNVTISGIWQINTPNDNYNLDLQGYDTIFYDWNPNASQVSLGADDENIYQGYYNWSGMNIKSIGSQRMEVAGISYQGTNDNITYSTFTNIEGLSLYNAPSVFVIENVDFYDSKRGITLGGNWSAVNGGYTRNVNFYNHSGTFLSFTNVTNYLIENIVAHSYNDESTGYDNLILQGTYTDAGYYTDEGGHDITINNVSINGSSRSAICFKKFVYNVTGSNLSVINSGHNNFDFHSFWNVSLSDLYSEGAADDDNIQITTSDYNQEGNYGIYNVHNRTGDIDERTYYTVSHNINIDNYTSVNPGGSGIYANIVIDLLLKDSSFSGGLNGIKTACSEGITIINSTSDDISAYSAILGSTDGAAFSSYGWSNDTKLIDCDFEKDGVPTWLLWSTNTTFINYNETDWSFYVPVGPDEYAFSDMESYQYLNARVLNGSGCPVANAIFTAETPAKNGYGTNQATFYTDDSGYIDTNNKSNQMAILDYYRNNSVTIQYDVNITVTKDGETDSQVVTMDGTYSANTSTGGLSGTLYSFTLDVAGVGEPVEDHNSVAVVTVMITSVIATAIYLGRSKIKTSLFNRWKR